MHQHNQADQASEIAFEPSYLIEYGEARELTKNGGAPTNQPQDGNQYNS